VLRICTSNSEYPVAFMYCISVVWGGTWPVSELYCYGFSGNDWGLYPFRILHTKLQWFICH